VIAIVDYGMGNRRSVEKAFEHVGAHPRLTGDHDTIGAADGIVVPGVGAFPEAMRRLRAAGLDDLIAERAEAGVPASACAWACSCCSRAPTSTRGRPASGSCPAG
jgi:imidazole glycerol-phosphate synthase subunit HisH